MAHAVDEHSHAADVVLVRQELGHDAAHANLYEKQYQCKSKDTKTREGREGEAVNTTKETPECSPPVQ